MGLVSELDSMSIEVQDQYNWKDVYSHSGNAFNPAFVYTVSLLVTTTLGLLGLYQLAGLVLSAKRRSDSMTYSVLSLIRLTFAMVASASLGALYISTSKHSLLANALTAVFVILPLQLLEPSYSPVAHASVLLFWLTNSVLSNLIIIQDLLSIHKIYYFNKTDILLELLIAFFSVAVLILEAIWYKPSFEINKKSLNYNIFSGWTYSWISSLIDQIYETDTIAVEDLPIIGADLQVDSTYTKLSSNWNKSVLKAKIPKRALFRNIPFLNRINRPQHPSEPSLFGSLANSFKNFILLTLLFELIDVALVYSQPFIFRNILVFISEYSNSTGSDSPPITKGFVLSILIFVITVVDFVIKSQSTFISTKALFAVDSSLTFLIYTKSLKLNPNARKNKTTGDIINHITTDTMTIKRFFSNLGDFVGGPIRLIICLVSLYAFLGVATLGGIAAAAIFIPFVSLITSAIQSIFHSLMKHKENRTSFVNELLLSMKSVKLYSWEGPMLKRLTELREKELDCTRSIGVYGAYASFVWSCIPIFISCAIYASFAILYDTPLTPDIIFPSMALFNLLTQSVSSLPMLITSLAEARTSLIRVGTFLVLEELDPDQGGVFIRHDQAASSGPSVSVKNATFLWAAPKVHVEEGTIDDLQEQVAAEEEATEAPSTNPIAFSNINFTAQAGQLTCLVGKVGSGKTTLLRCILGELQCSLEAFSDESNSQRPSVSINGNIAYCPQSPWILNASVRENIMFGHKFDQEFYNKTIDACELMVDFATLPDGDRTVVGEKGISLSGGQRARVSLARAVYSRADIYLLDDILSAVDSHVGKNIIDKVLSDTGIIGNRTKILATNSVSILHKANMIYMLKSGKISESGNFDAVVKSKGDLADLIEEFSHGKDEVAGLESDSAKTSFEADALAEEAVEIISEVAGTGSEEGSALQRRASIVSFNHVYVEDVEYDDDGNPKLKRTGDTEEFMVRGNVKLEIMWEYCKACNYKLIILYVFLVLATLIFGVLQRYLLTYWSEINYEAGHTENPVFFLFIFAALGLTSGLISYVSAYFIWTYCILQGSKILHDKMAKSILRSPMSFFETTPTGRILNRFTDDVATIDLQLPWMYVWLLMTILTGVVTLSVIIFTFPIMIIVIGILLLFYNHFRIRYMPASRQLKRLQKIAKSPLLITIQESVDGIDTIKAFGQTERFTHKSKALINNLISVSLVAQVSSMWLTIRLKFMTSFIVFSLTVLATYSLTTATPITAGLFGFLSTYAMQVTQILQGFIRSWTEVQTQSVSIERIFEYSVLTPEAEMILEDSRPPENWPDRGEIEFKNYSTRYRENLDLVLKDINISIKSKEKIGVVGRTGAGKSSLTLALFRIIEPTSGCVEIDHVNSSGIGLYDLRHSLTIIPQESHIIRGTLRENLDPFDQYPDSRLWKVLELAHLKAHVESMRTDPTEAEVKANKGTEALKPAFGLSAKLDEGGSNLSSGQKQLLSLARALLNEKSRILVLDEATASVDVQTDKIIQETIRSEFKDKTILTIAHRLETVMDSDRVLVLSEGMVKEFDTPSKLLKDQSSMFYSLCREGGYLKN